VLIGVEPVRQLLLGLVGLLVLSLLTQKLNDLVLVQLHVLRISAPSIVRHIASAIRCTGSALPARVSTRGSDEYLDRSNIVSSAAPNSSCSANDAMRPSEDELAGFRLDACPDP
jgi:hypothetical protein